MEEQTPQEVELDYNLEHRAFLEENGIDLKKVPKSIRSKMRSMNMLIGKYKNNPTEANKNVVIKNDIMICDMLQDWQEQDYPDDYVDSQEPSNEPTPAEPTEPTPAEPTEPTPAEPTEPTPAEPTEPTPAEPTEPTPVEPQNNEAEMEKKIKENLMQGTNRIKISVLKSIIGKTPNHPKQKVGSLMLKKVFLNDCYEIV